MKFPRLDQRLHLILGSTTLLALGGLAGWFLNQSMNHLTYRPYREEGEYQFISPLLFVGVDEEFAFPKYQHLKQQMAAQVNEEQGTPGVESMSVYFHNLTTSQWVGVNTEEQFAPASMLKVITLMSVLRESEKNPRLLSQRVMLEDVEEAFPDERAIYEPEHPIQSGRAYTVDALLGHLVVDSDNGANYALTKLIGEEKKYETYDALQLARPIPRDDPGYTAREYSRVFRTLYNGTYLSRSLSEQALKLLSTTNFTKGLVMGLPDGVTVSHKFGVRSVRNAEGTGYASHELHDCGIVYHPKEPYFICVMTRGTDLPSLEEAIQKTSRTVWEEVEALN